ncbi:hypothetical protein O7626_05815 [Micromonospora sp. WMMD1102]|uniref:hypothetical protein n=1 Tax=Micromonospora sp. WMMD1102 TaxID=3016105 RepID=UPI0024156597|nr:hypothetical protein [Micromonospora sp. WMMD1102]MDG4785453.1 hypothetical protein [Micromonospora sp. WMMD1102]
MIKVAAYKVPTDEVTTDEDLDALLAEATEIVSRSWLSLQVDRVTRCFQAVPSR